MPITRTIMTDDDGSGTTGTILNNAWLQTIYGQIDGLVGVPTAWTPVDNSGAGLVFTVTEAFYCITGKVVTVTVNMSFPATSNSNTVKIAGLPGFLAWGASGFYTMYPATFPIVWHISNATNAIIGFNGSTGAALTNAMMSGQPAVFAGLYHI